MIPVGHLFNFIIVQKEKDLTIIVVPFCSGKAHPELL